MPRARNEEAFMSTFYIFLHHSRRRGAPVGAPCGPRPPMTVKPPVARNFGHVNGWRNVRTILPPMGFDDHASRSFRRGGGGKHVVEEAKAIPLTGVGLLFDAHRFTKHLVKGPGGDRNPELVHL